MTFSRSCSMNIAHGLGFSGSMTAWDGNPPASSAPCNPPAGQGCWGINDPRVPFIYDQFTENQAGQTLINDAVFPNPSAQLKTELEGGADYLFFTGGNAAAANGGNRVPLYSPSAWRQGSSYSHLDESFDNTPKRVDDVFSIPRKLTSLSRTGRPGDLQRYRLHGDPGQRALYRGRRVGRYRQRHFHGIQPDHVSRLLGIGSLNPAIAAPDLGEGIANGLRQTLSPNPPSILR